MTVGHLHIDSPYQQPIGILHIHRIARQTLCRHCEMKSHELIGGVIVGFACEWVRMYHLHTVDFVCMDKDRRTEDICQKHRQHKQRR